MEASLALEHFHPDWKEAGSTLSATLSLRGAERRSNLPPDEQTSARPAGDGSALRAWCPVSPIAGGGMSVDRTS